MHWFSRPAFVRASSRARQTEMSAETALLLEHLTESTCCSTATSPVRELAATCLAEFLKWTIKQTSDQCLWEDAAVPELLFRKMQALATHPSADKRLGATLILDKLQHILRES